MIPLELKIDNDGLLYIDEHNNLVERLIQIDKRRNKDEFYKSEFYTFLSTNDYIIKKPITVLDRRNRKLYKDMLIKLINKQVKVLNTDFPIGYLKDRKNITGLIVKYYKDGISLDNIIDLYLVGKYYYHDDDIIHNLFLLLHDVLDNIYEMFENEIYYIDISEGNIILNNNEVKIIDFDPIWVRFDLKDKMLEKIIWFYMRFVVGLLNKYGLCGIIKDERAHNFEEAKKNIKRFEGRIRKYNK